MADSGALRELIAFLGFDVDDKPLQKADERLKNSAARSQCLGAHLARQRASD